MLGNVYVLLSEPESVEPVLSSSVHISKGFWEYLFFRPWLNDGLLLSTGDKWRLRRKLLTPSFHFKILESFLGGISKNSELYVASLLESGGKPIDIQEPISMATLKIICETAMGVTLSTDNEEQNAFIKAIKDASEGIVLRYLTFWLYSDFIYRRSKFGKKFYKSIDTLHSFSKKVIRKRKELYQSEKSHLGEGNKSGRKAFLDLLLEVEDSNPGLFSEADIQEEVDTFMFEGHDTVSASIIFSHFLLATHPDVQEKAFKEQDEIFGNDRRPPSMQDLQKMTYLEMVIKETLRLYPSVPFHSRKLYQDLKIDENTVVPAGQSIGILTYYIHRSVRHWEDPELFIPERFDPEITRHPFSYIPFSAGPRNCIGQKLAMMEIKTLLSTVLRNCVLESVTKSVDPVASVIIRNLGPIIVKVLPRDGTL
ncbi:cytochrome P450 4C1 isoform X2 [Halyomorpha halys]|nr:cytochrome P450 4C1-like isoform X2 [Halyomorpha halys]XP_014270543.1 cytochrome P450 4C1-like isoform X2 [Halyomorpha halys]XP_014270544.1 cytochrome P450 4C1-like isoform X2 [Halyomorpha halys]XP_014270545.1 cytochrome P450 4C1-like isoform X2 [Halyomorpha halys]